MCSVLVLPNQNACHAKLRKSQSLSAIQHVIPESVVLGETLIQLRTIDKKAHSAVQRTSLVFQQNGNLTTLETVITAVRLVSSVEDGNQSLYKQAKDDDHVVVTEATIFHPQGGGQASDVGLMKGAAGSVFEVMMARMDVVNQGQVLHFGRFTSGSSFPAGTPVTQTINSEKRLLYSRYHTAGHVLGAAVRRLLENEVPNFDELKASHFPDSAACEFQGLIEGRWKEAIQKQLDEYIAQDSKPPQEPFHYCRCGSQPDS